MITLVPTQESRQSIRNLAAFFLDLNTPTQEMTKEIGDLVRSAFASNFANESDGDGEPWYWLADWTRRERIYEGYDPDHPILVRTGGYKGSFTDPGAAYQETFVMEGGFRIEFGSEDERVTLLEGGDSYVLPPRPVTIIGAGAEEALGFLLDSLFEVLADRVP